MLSQKVRLIQKWLLFKLGLDPRCIFLLKQFKKNKDVALIFSMGIIFRIVLNKPGNKIIEKI